MEFIAKCICTDQTTPKTNSVNMAAAACSVVPFVKTYYFNAT